jgi:hypothetical protein
MQMRPELAALVSGLLAREEEQLTLDMIAETIGAAQVSTDDIDRILQLLEDRGRLAEEPAHSASAELSVTLASARRLRMALKRAPTPEEIAGEANISVSAVRRALLFARMLQR